MIGKDTVIFTIDIFTIKLKERKRGVRKEFLEVKLYSRNPYTHYLDSSVVIFCSIPVMD